MMCRVISLLLVGAAAACGHSSSVGTLRYRNQAPVWKVNDRTDVPSKPAMRPFPEKLYFFDGFFYDRALHAVNFDAPVRAQNVNAIGGVPDSTWFTNRIGVRDLSLAELAGGPNHHAGPDTSEQLVITSSKTGGGSAGFIVKDARGDKYIFKFDEAHAPITESATDVAVQRLLWACGYNVPEDSIIYFRRDDLVLAEDAAVKDLFGNKRPMTEADLDEQLARSSQYPDGRYRALASKFLPGIPVGGFPQQGVRSDDPNDLIAHEHRRELRGLFLIFGWLQQTDAKEDNTLDMWVEGSDGRHYLRHYLVDFGKSFGTSALIVKRPGDGHVANLDFEFIVKGVASLGLWKRPYEGTTNPGIEGLGIFDAEHYDPGDWKSHVAYRPFDFVDSYDLLWAAGIIMRFTPEQLRVAVEQGAYENPRAVDYLVETLVERQRRIGRYVFARTNPLDDFVVDDGNLCFDDLLLRYGLDPGAAALTHYTVSAYDFDGAPLSWEQPAAPLQGRPWRETSCVGGFPEGATHDGYTILRVATSRRGKSLAPIEVHLARSDGTGLLSIIGINRR